MIALDHFDLVDKIDIEGEFIFVCDHLCFAVNLKVKIKALQWRLYYCTILQYITIMINKEDQLTNG